MLDLTNLSYYREGLVGKESLDNIFCCHIAEVEKPVLHYVELVYRDGSRRYIYDDEDGFAFFENNFVAKRFTSFHEFFTTDQDAIEDRGFLKLKYYVRHDDSAYIHTDVQDALKELKAAGAVQKAPRLTQLGHYDGEVNYHEDDSTVDDNSKDAIKAFE